MSAPEGSPEQALWSGGPARRNWWPRFGAALLFALAAGPLFVRYGPSGLLFLPLAALVAAGAVLRSRLDRYSLTTQRVVWEHGFLGRQRREVELKDIRQLTLQQSVFQRLLGVGDVEIESAGGPEIDLRLGGVARPAEVMERVRQARVASLGPIHN